MFNISKKLKQLSSDNAGFTPIEILLVGAAVCMFIALIIIAINPAKRFSEQRDAKRQTDVSNILNAVYKYSVNNEGVMPPIPVTATEICADGVKDCTGFVDLHVLVEGKFIEKIPKDPKSECSENSTCYKIEQTSNGRVIVKAPHAENNTITATR